MELCPRVRHNNPRRCPVVPYPSPPPSSALSFPTPSPSAELCAVVPKARRGNDNAELVLHYWGREGVVAGTVDVLGRSTPMGRMMPTGR